MPVFIILLTGGMFLSIFFLIYFQLQDIRQSDKQILLIKNELAQFSYETELIEEEQE
jgi:hypothetical protein